MRSEVDQLGGLPRPANRSLDNRVGSPGEGHDAPVVIGIRFGSQQEHARGLLNCIRDRQDDGGIPPLGEIRNTFEHRTIIKD